jgi:hypothetical protein
MRLPEEIEREHITAKLTEAGILREEGDAAELLPLPLPSPGSPAKIPLNHEELIRSFAPAAYEQGAFFPPEQRAFPDFPGSGESLPCPEDAERPAYEVADIFRLYGEAYRQKHSLTPQQAAVMRDIEICRTEALGFHADVCDGCGHIEIRYNSCRNRHCPKCQGIAKRKWVNARLTQLLPIPYYHAVFTLPTQIFPLCQYNQELIYELIFSSAAETLKAFGKDPRWLGAEPGFYGILHTWGQTVCQHLHIHFIVTGGGLNEDGEWVSPKCGGKFLFPVCALSKVFRGKFIGGLKKAYYDGDLTIPDEKEELREPHGFEKWLNYLVARRWVVYAKAPFAGPEEVVRYIGRYTHRVAISNPRIISVGNGQVTFSYKDYKDSGRRKEMTLSADGFIRRFLLHVLPPGFHRIRHYGILANGKAAKNTELIRELLKTEDEAPEVTEDEASGGDQTERICPVCGTGKMIPVLIIHPHHRKILSNDLFPYLTGEKAYDTS